jgi:thiol-disulfide isomerase/thioredoxin
MDKKYSKLMAMLLVMACTSVASAQVKFPSKINGVLKGGGNRVVYLSSDYMVPNDKKTILDSTALRNDTLSFKSKDLPPAIYTFFLKGDKKYLPVFLDGSDIRLNGDAEKIYLTKISGSKETDIANAFYTALKQDKIKEDVVFRAILNADQNKNQDSLNFYHRKLDSIQSKLYKKVDSLITAYPHSFYTIRYLDAYDTRLYSDEKELEILNGMPAIYKTSDDYNNLRDKLIARKTFAVGSKFKNFQLADINNHVINTKDHSGYLLVDFWASWCVPCRHANPVLKKLYETYQSKGLDIISVSIDESMTAWKNAVKTDGLPWKQLIADKGPETPEIAPYAITAVPSTYLIDSKGTIIAKNLSPEELTKKVESLFKN